MTHNATIAREDAELRELRAAGASAAGKLLNWQLDQLPADAPAEDYRRLVREIRAARARLAEALDAAETARHQGAGQQ